MFLRCTWNEDDLTGSGKIADEEELAFGADLPQVAKLAKGTRDAYAMRAYEKTDLFMREGKGDGPSTINARAGLARYVDEHLVKTVVEIRARPVRQPSRKGAECGGRDFE